MFRNLNRGLAIAVLSVTLGAVAIPSIVAAQSSSTPSSQTTTQQHHRGGGWKQLNLTDAQKQQLKTLHENTKQQVQAVLTDDQRAKLAAAIQSGDRKGAWKSLNLTTEQKQKIRDIRKSSKEQGLAILTPEQKAQLAQMRAEHHRK
ncbi:Spy/CpxP family protein refolding chaperone [Tumidithrix elongata RA019]|uniref:Spy/CpxP family protein refolding chaperone n=1 Tax=Tumidithrix elongata BACA0141 TaxID=2716417 RepID=A0AAW9PVA1_9CYAN|nr:Spy/CpxP family protein refolding chaperone [Tumidithrix elongata RA019]